MLVYLSLDQLTSLIKLFFILCDMCVIYDLVQIVKYVVKQLEILELYDGTPDILYIL